MIKNNTMKRYHFIVVFFLLATAGLHSAEHPGWQLSIEPLFGLKSGTFGEYVFLKNCDYSSDKLSYLAWELKPSLTAGARFNARYNHINSTVYITGTFPGNSGLMQDSDWLNTQFDNAGSYQYKTNYSESDNVLNSNIVTGIQTGYTFTILPWLNVVPFAAFDFEYFQFTAHGGTCWYGNDLASNSGSSADGMTGPYYPSSDSSHRTVSTMTGKVVRYTRCASYTWVGLSSEISLPRKFILTMSIQGTPFVYCQSQDEHLLTGKTYVDVTSGFFCAYRTSAALSYGLSPRTQITLSGRYFFLQTITGDTYETDSGTVLLSSLQGGADAQYAEMTVSCIMRIR